MDIVILEAAEARKLIATGTPIGWAHTTASGAFQQGYQLPDGSHIDHYLNFGWLDKYILTPNGYHEPQSVAYRRGWNETR